MDCLLLLLAVHCCRDCRAWFCSTNCRRLVLLDLSIRVTKMAKGLVLARWVFVHRNSQQILWNTDRRHIQTQIQLLMQSLLPRLNGPVQYPYSQELVSVRTSHMLLPLPRHCMVTLTFRNRDLTMEYGRSGLFTAILLCHCLTASLSTTVLARLQGLYIACNILYGSFSMF